MLSVSHYALFMSETATPAAESTRLMRMIASAEAKFDAHRSAVLTERAENAFAFNRRVARDRLNANAAKCARQRNYSAGG